MTRTPTPSAHGRFITALRAALGLDPRPDIWLRGPRPSLRPSRKPANITQEVMCTLRKDKNQTGQTIQTISLPQNPPTS